MTALSPDRIAELERLLADTRVPQTYAQLDLLREAFPALLAERERLRAENERLTKLLGPDYHVYEQREDGWSLKHPVACREEMLDCPVHLAASQYDEPPVEPSRYRVELNSVGSLNFYLLAEGAPDE